MSTTHSLHDLLWPTIRRCSTAGCNDYACFVDRARTPHRDGIVLAFYPLCYDCAVRLGFTEAHGTDERGFKKVTKLDEVAL